jgi:ABC-type transport system involved in multi-copper enzyme maturation permease subunit
MIWRMILKELTTNILELRFLVCATLCVLLGVVSVFVLRADLEIRQQDFHSNRALYRKQVEEYGSYRSLQSQGLRVDRPPQNFQALFYGLEKTPDRTAVISSDFLPGFQGDLNSNLLVLMFPVADLYFVVGVVLSLLAFFMSFDAISGERETGTLKLLLSYSVPRGAIILSKWIGGYLSLALPFGVTMLLSALIINTSGDIAFTGTDWQAFAVSGVVSLLLIAVMFSFGLFVSVRAQRSSTAILQLLFLWVFVALALPNSGPYIAELVSPVPDVAQVERQIAEKVKGLSDEFRGTWRRGGRGRRDMTPAQRSAFFAEITAKREELRQATNEASEEIIRDFERKLRFQTDVARTVSRISPIASYAYASTDIGETGVRHEYQLVSGLRQYQREFRRYLDEKVSEAPGGGGFGNFGGSTDEDYSIDDMPIFEYQAEDVGVRLDSRTTDVLLLVIFAVLFFLLAFVSFLKADIN